MKKKKTPRKKPARAVSDKAPLSLDELRGQIDSIDTRILGLLNDRALVALWIGEEKIRTGKTGIFYDPEREQRIFERLEERAGEAFPRHAIRHVFKEITSACRSLETQSRVVFLGPAGTYTQIAAQQLFGNSSQYIEASTIEGVFEAVGRKQVEYGVVPLENSSAGGVSQTLEALMRSEVMIRREHILEISHALASRESEFKAIRRVYSHPQALAQCRAWLALNLPAAELIESDSTGLAAKTAAGEAGAAAICSSVSAELTGLKILQKNIQDRKENATRFVILSLEDGPRTGRDRTSLLLSPRGGQKSLPRLLDVFLRARIEVTRLESRASSRSVWSSVYFLDIEGHREDPSVKRALKAAEKLCDEMKLLGSYPQARVGGLGR